MSPVPGAVRFLLESRQRDSLEIQTTPGITGAVLFFIGVQEAGLQLIQTELGKFSLEQVVGSLVSSPFIVMIIIWVTMTTPVSTVT